MKKSSAWYAFFPGDVYALGPFRFEQPITERDFRAYLRQDFCETWWGYEPKRPPVGVQVWPAS